MTTTTQILTANGYANAHAFAEMLGVTTNHADRLITTRFLPHTTKIHGVRCIPTKTVHRLADEFKAEREQHETARQQRNRNLWKAPKEPNRIPQPLTAEKMAQMRARALADRE